MNEDIKHMHKELFKEENFNTFNPDPTPQSGKQFLIMIQNKMLRILNKD